MSEHPILFSSEMIRAILDGRKTQTRRTINPQPVRSWNFETPVQLGRITSAHPKMGKFGAFIKRGIGSDFPECDIIACPYGQPGDSLWVRETHVFVSDWMACTPGIVYKADGAVRWRVSMPDGTNVYNVEKPDIWKWRPSIFMPRWASRINLEISNIRVERVRDISEDGARAEGGEPFLRGSGTPRQDFRAGYESLWNSINEKRGYGWEANPWVWVVEFKVTP